ncbi:hypothetical protein MRX96_001853 [Rhipicephalus microplus]
MVATADAGNQARVYISPVCRSASKNGDKLPQLLLPKKCLNKVFNHVPNTVAPVACGMLRTHVPLQWMNLLGTTYPRWDIDSGPFDVIGHDWVSHSRKHVLPSGREQKALPLTGPLSFQ